MNKLKLICGLSLAVFVIFTGPAVASVGGGKDAHAGEGKDAHAGEGKRAGSEFGVGSGKAVEGFEHGRRIKLSAKAVARLEIKTGKAEFNDGVTSVPVASLVAIRERYFVFVVNGRWFEYWQVKVISRDGMNAVLEGSIGGSGEIVLKGAGILRLIELDIEAGEKGGGHSH